MSAEEYFLQCQLYIEMNPVRAGMVVAPGEYAWSSFRSNGLGKSTRLWTPHEVYTALGDTPESCAQAYCELFQGHIDLALLTQIRQAVNQGMAQGNGRFKQEISQLSGRRVNTLKRGPKPKSDAANKFLLSALASSVTAPALLYLVHPWTRASL